MGFFQNVFRFNLYKEIQSLANQMKILGNNFIRNVRAEMLLVVAVKNKKNYESVHL